MKSVLAGLIFALSVPLATAADYMDIKRLYNQGEYQQSFPLLLEQARLGYAPAQITLAESYAKGHGSKIDYPSAYAWALMAKEQNHPMAESLYLEYRTKLTSRRAGKQLFAQLKGRFGQQALKQSLYPTIHSPAMPLSPQPDPLQVDEVEYPTDVYEQQESFWLLLQFDVAEDGHTENIKTLDAYPDDKFSQTIIDSVAKWRFKPQTDDQNNPIRFDLQTRLFTLYPQHSSYIGSQASKTLLKQAKNGHAQSQYLLAHLIEHEVISKSYGQPLEWLIKAAINGFGPAQFKLFHCLNSQSRCATASDKALKWLTMAQNSGQQGAQIHLARAMLNAQNSDAKKAKAMLEALVQSNHLPALILYAKLLASSKDPQVKNLEQAIKYAQQAMALDNNHPQLLGVLAVAHFELGKAEQAQNFLTEAIREAEYRRWPIDYYVDLLEQYQRATLLGESLPQDTGN